MAFVDPLASAYAQALVQAAEAEGGAARIEESVARIGALAEAWRKNRILRAYLVSSEVSAPQRRAAIERVLAGWPRTAANFVRLVHRRGRLALLPAIADALVQVLDERLNRVPVTLATAKPVPQDMLLRWTDVLRKALGKEPVVKHVVRPELVAGAVVRAGDIVADGSARRRLAEWKQRILRGTYAHQP